MDGASVPKRNEALKGELLDDELLLYYESETQIIALNPTASLVWTLCDGERSLATIKDLLVEAYPDEATRIPIEVTSIVEKMVHIGALQLEAISGSVP